MSKISPEKRRFFLAAMLLSTLQMAMFAPQPGIQKITTEVFPDRTLADVQTAMMLPSISSLVCSILSSFLISRRVLSKKGCVVLGTGLMGFVAVVAMVLHSSFWQLQLFSILIGVGMGFLVAPLSSVMFDQFNETERRLSMGTQSAFINGGAIVLSVGGGLLTRFVWYGGYMMLLLAIPLVAVAAKFVPKDIEAEPAPADQPKKKGARLRLPAAVFYYGLIAALNAVINNVCATNMSTHLDNAQLGDSATAGVATAIQMAGGVVMGLIFDKVSARLRDFTIPLAFVFYALGYLLVSLGTASLLLIFLGVFLAGMAMSLLVPQVLFSTSNCCSVENSAPAVALVNSVMPGIGGYLSPVIFTNVTQALRPGSTVFRFQFVAGVSLILGAVIFAVTALRARKSAPRENA